MFHIGQRWYSEGEPELGLGLVMSSKEKLVTILFPLSEIERTYNKSNPPLKRFLLATGDEFLNKEDESFIIEDVKEENNLFFYLSSGKWISEVSINPQIDLSGPLERLLVQNFDSNSFYNLRYKAYLAFRNYEKCSFKGFLGAKMSLIPHQIYLAGEILADSKPRYMLCDEVGLGKTIESCLVLHALIQKEIVQSSLIIVPESLVNQWFIELYKKFSLSFKTISSETRSEIDLSDSQHYIVSSSLLKEESEISDILLSSKWDMLIVDESHQIPFSQKENFQTQVIQNISNQAYGVLFLSATPEVLGADNLFAQLSVLDPQRYFSFEDFKEKSSNYSKISELISEINLQKEKPKELENYFKASEIEESSSELLVDKLVDRYGQGRSFFRNSRSSLEKTQKLFTQRKLQSYPIKRPKVINDKIVAKQKAVTLYEIVEKHSSSKILVICHSREIVKQTSATLLSLANLTIAEFHSEQSLLERDRQAAYFADPEGAQILICTEIGSEGRNFEFAHHLVLLDLPKIPDQLEQRIGRLDRIGQTQDILIHVPFIEESFEEVLFRWYSEVLESFSKFPKGGFGFYQDHKSELMEMIESPDYSDLDAKLNKLRVSYLEFEKTLEKGRDYLVEQRSFDYTKAREQITQIEEFESSTDCRIFLENVCEAVGINFEQLNDYVYFIEPSDNMLLPSYPGLSSEGLSVTFSRSYSNRHINIDYMNWEHPIIRGAFELLLNSPLGNVSIVKTSELPRNIYFEFIIAVQTQGKHAHESSRYLPFTPFRSLLDVQGEDHTLRISKKELDQIGFEKATDTITQALRTIPKDQFVSLSKKAVANVSERVLKLKKKGIKDIKDKYTNERARVNSLAISEQERDKSLEELNSMEQELLIEIDQASIELDAIRVIFPSE